MNKHYIQIRPDARVVLANGQPAYTRNRRVTQSMIDQFGSRAKVLAAMEAGVLPARVAERARAKVGG